LDHSVFAAAVSIKWRSTSMILVKNRLWYTGCKQT